MRILFLDIDTLRPDHMGCYGYNRNTTPNIDQNCAEGVRFTQHYCADAPCLPSRAGLITGMFGIRSGAVGHGGTAADKKITGIERGFRDPVDTGNFINIFRKAGMKTASISTFAERHSSWWFNAGFNETYNVGKGGM
jgi:arylsulfatase A-like enzyme